MKISFQQEISHYCESNPFTLTSLLEASSKVMEGLHHQKYGLFESI